MGKTILWSNENLSKAREILGKYNKEDKDACIAEVQRVLGFACSMHTLRHALHQNRMGTLNENMKQRRSNPGVPFVPPSPQSTPSMRPAATAVEMDVDSEISNLVAMVNKKPISYEQALNDLKTYPAKLNELVEEAIERGFRVEFLGGHIGLRPVSQILEEQEVRVSPAGDPHLLAVVGDLHYGNKHHLNGPFQDFCQNAYKQGVRTFVQVGDLLDGNYKHSEWEQTARGFDEQVKVAIQLLPKWKDAVWHFIQGNHDEKLGEQNGMDVGKAIELAFRDAGRKDLVYHGARAAYLRIKVPHEKRGLLIEVWHPRDRAAAYAKSYRLQKKVEQYQPGQKPDALFAGHWHQAMYLPVRGVHCISAGCFQGSQSSFGKSLSGSPDIGSWIVEYAMTAAGTVRSFGQRWKQYFEVEHIRDVNLG